MVSEFKNKRVILPLIFGILFSILYYILPIKYFGASIVAFVAVILVFYDIRIGILSGMFVVPFLPDTLNILYMIFLVGVFSYQHVTREDVMPLTKSSIDMPIILFGIIIIISTITSISPTGSFRDLVIHLSGLGFLFVMVNSIRDVEDFNVIVTMLVFSATLVALYGLYQYVVGVEIEAAWVDVENNPDVKTRIYSVFGNPNILAEYLILTIPMSVALFWQSKKLHKKILFLGTTLIMTLALVLTLSRGGWIGFAVAALIFIVLVEKRILLSLIPLSVAAVYLLPQSIINRILSIGNLADSSNAYRIKIWDITLEIIKDNWISGVGFGHLPFKQTFETYIRTMPTYHAHNTYLQTAAEIGVPGLIAFLFFLFILFKYGVHKLIKKDNNYIKIMGAGALAGIGGLFAHGAVENVLYLPKIIITFWILVSFILTLIRISEKEEGLS